MKTKLKRDNSANNQSLRSNRTNWITQTTLIWSKLFSKKKQHVRITVHSSSHMQNEINKSTFRSKTIHLHSSVKPQAGYRFFFTFHNSASTTSFNLLNAWYSYVEPKLRIRRFCSYLYAMHSKNSFLVMFPWRFKFKREWLRFLCNLIWNA